MTIPPNCHNRRGVLHTPLQALAAGGTKFVGSSHGLAALKAKAGDHGMGLAQLGNGGFDFGVALAVAGVAAKVVKLLQDDGGGFDELLPLGLVNGRWHFPCFVVKVEGVNIVEQAGFLGKKLLARGGRNGRWPRPCSQKRPCQKKQNEEKKGEAKEEGTSGHSN